MPASRRSSSEDREIPASADYVTEIHAPVDVMHLAQLMAQLMGARSAAEARSLIEQHSELLSDYTWFMTDRLVEDARASGDAEAVLVLHERRAVLQRCREVGVAAAFREFGL